MELKQNIFQVVCVVSSILGLLLIYFAALNTKPSEVSISKIDESLVGRSVTVSGFISYLKFHPDGHIFITVSDNTTKIQVPLFSSFLSSARIDVSNIKVGRKVVVSGIVDVYKNQLQIVPNKADDFKVLGA